MDRENKSKEKKKAVVFSNAINNIPVSMNKAVLSARIFCMKL